MATLFNFEVYTPYRLFFSELVEVVTLTLIDGEASVYANHSPFTAPVVPCLLKIKNSSGIWKSAFTAEGILEVNSHKTILLSDSAEWPNEIDTDRASAAKERAEQTIATGMFKFEIETAVTALKRAETRLKARKEALKKS